MRTITLFALVLLGASALQAQTISPVVIGSAGGEGTADDVTIMWTLGEVAVTTLQNDAGYVTQGFHQPPLGTTDVPYEIVTLGSGEIHPNPATDRVSVAIDEPVSGAVDVRLFRVTGESVTRFETVMNDGHAVLDTRNVPTGVYVLRIEAESVRYNAFVTITR